MSPGAPQPEDATLPMVAAAEGERAATDAKCRIRIDASRARGRQQRGPAPVLQAGTAALLGVADLVSGAQSDQFVRLDAAVRRLEAEDPGVAQIVRLRFCAGLGGQVTAAALGKSPATVDRDWSWARAWLFWQLRPACP